MNIVITGASRGIGLATAKRLDTSDSNLFLVASSKDSFKGDFKNARLFGCDMSKSDQINNLVSEITGQVENIDLLINIAGVMTMKKFEDLDESDISTMIDLNLKSHALLTNKLLPAIKKSRSGQIIFMSSMAAKSSIVGESIYAATKAAVTHFANVLRNELGPDVRVSTVHAWGVDTWGAPNPQDFIRPEDIAEVFDYISKRPDTMMIESIDLSNPAQWRGGQAPWSPQ